MSLNHSEEQEEDDGSYVGNQTKIIKNLKTELSQFKGGISDISGEYDGDIVTGNVSLILLD